MDSCWTYDTGGLVLDLGTVTGDHTFDLYEGNALVSADLRAKSTLSIGCGSNPSGLSPGTHVFELRAVNGAGVESAGVQVTVEALCVENPGGNSPECLRLSDVGTTGPDGGTTSPDGGTTSPDGGAAGQQPGGPGMGCAAVGAAASFGWWVLLPLALRRGRRTRRDDLK